ncbi:MAG: DrmB family protein [Jatrophihabitans sp.]
MTAQLPQRQTTKGQPTRIGNARPSHLITTASVGAVVDLPTMSVIVRGLDAWQLERAESIEEPRLLDLVRHVLGPQIRALRKPPWDPRDTEDPWTRTGVPVSPFPRWLRCPRCHRLGPMDPPGQFELVHRYGKRPDLAKWVHSQCGLQVQTADARKRACLPARFLVVCDAGHLDDFPYNDFVHHGRTEPCGGPRLKMRDSASTLGPRVTVTCDECGASRNLQSAAGRDGSAALPRCRGRHPHLQRFEACGKPLRLMVLGASNIWFSVTASALHLPRGESVGDLVSAHWDVLGQQPNPTVVQTIIDGMDPLRGLRDVPIDEVWATIEKVRADGGPRQQQASGDLLQAEWQLLARPTTERQDADFRAVVTPSPAGYDKLLDQVVLVNRLREIQALVGFTRLSAPERRELDPLRRLPLSRATPTWVPAFEQRGEGVFLQLREDLVRAWTERVEDHSRINALRRSYVRWADNRDTRPNPSFPVPRYLLLHTLSHLLIRQVALECGYSPSSIRERLYIGTPQEPATGILLSTAASDSEGTLGGLVALGEARYLKTILDRALEDAARCSSDPLCAEHVPQDPSDTLHAAACHACLFASETSCEANNRWLDRTVLLDLTGDGLAFL